MSITVFRPKKILAPSQNMVDIYKKKSQANFFFCNAKVAKVKTIHVIKNKHCILNLIYIYLGMISLIYASKYGHLDVVRFLVDSGADIHAKNYLCKLVQIFFIKYLLFNLLNLKYYCCYFLSASVKTNFLSYIVGITILTQEHLSFKNFFYISYAYQVNLFYVSIPKY